MLAKALITPKLRKSSPGYGLAMLMVFLVSTVMIGASLQMLAAPVSLSYLGSSSQDNLSAQEVANIGMETVLADIQTRRNNNQTVDTSYTYSSTSVTVPQDPASLGGSTTTLGSYSATMTAARGDAFLVKVTATVGSASYSLSKLIHINRNAYLLDSISGASAAYSLRKLRSAYSGSAIRVVRPSDSSEQDIGFSPNGDLDIDSLKSFLGNATPPLDTVTSAKVAYSLRKLRTAYTGYAIRVRRSSDNSEQDIGFTSTGDLDTGSLLDFVGTGSGYVKTWYDQSGNSKDLTQTTTASQPRIVSSGVLGTSNGLPTLYFDGSDDCLFNSSITGTITGANITSFVTASTNSGTYIWGRFVVLHKNNDVDEWETTTSIQLLSLTGDAYSVQAHTNSMGAAGYNNVTPGTLFQATTYHDSTNLKFYVNSALQESNAVSANLAPDYLVVGSGRSNTSISDYAQGTVSELIVYNSNLSTANRQIVERGQSYYYRMNAFPWGYVKTWYDQSGNSKDVTQSTTSAQPYITVTNNNTAYGSRPSVYFNGSQLLSRANGMPTSSDYSKSVVFSIDNFNNWNDLIGNTGGQHSLYISSSAHVFRLSHSTGGTTYFVGASTVPSLSTLYSVLGTFVSSSGLGTVYFRNASDGTGTGGANTDASIALGARSGSATFSGSLSEAIIFSKVLSSTERSVVYNDQQSYFGAL